MGKNLLLWLIIAAVLLTVFNNFNVEPEPETMSYSDFIELVRNDGVREVEIEGLIIHGWRANDDKDFIVIRPDVNDPKLLDDLYNHNVQTVGRLPEQQSIWAQLLIASFPILIIIAVFMLFMRQMQGGAGGRGGPMAFGKSKARLLSEDQIKTTFADVAGVDEAKDDVQELVEFLSDPGKFQRLGGRIPRGILMVGQPGTGKTLLAKAIAGEAKVPFFSISGSDFVEMFVGVGASRVRDMFEQAKKQAPCIIFIDEIDAVGRHRGAGLGRRGRLRCDRIRRPTPGHCDARAYHHHAGHRDHVVAVLFPSPILRQGRPRDGRDLPQRIHPHLPGRRCHHGETAGVDRPAPEGDTNRNQRRRPRGRIPQYPAPAYRGRAEPRGGGVSQRPYRLTVRSRWLPGAAWGARKRHCWRSADRRVRPRNLSPSYVDDTIRQNFSALGIVEDSYVTTLRG